MQDFFDNAGDILDPHQQALEQERQEILSKLQADAHEVLRCYIQQMDNLTDGSQEIGKLYPAQAAKLLTARVALGVARSYFSEALNDMIINQQQVNLPH